MLRLLITPKWLALTLVLLMLVAAFTWLGVWQWSRAVTAIAVPGNPSTGSFQPLRAVHEQGVPVTESAVGAPVVLRGRYIFADELYVPHRLQEQSSQSPEPETKDGYWVLTPLEVAPGELIPIVRGWVATPSASRQEPSGTVTVRGFLRASESDALREGVPDELGDNEIAVVSSPELLSRWEGQLWQGFVVLLSQDPDDPNAIEPVKQPAATEQSISWQSLAYAVQWWLFAAFAAFFYWRMLSLEYETTVGSASHPAEGQA